MVKKFKSIALAGAIVLMASPVLADDMMMPLTGIDMDPFHILTPAPAAAPAPMMKKHHMMKHHMKKKMMKKKMMKKKM